MGADAFQVYFGVRRTLAISDSETIGLLESRLHPWQSLARRFHLDLWWGQSSNEEELVVLLGHSMGSFGCEGRSHATLATDEAQKIQSLTQDRLQAAGIEDTAVWHFHFEPDD